MVHHLVIGIIFLIWGIADVLRLELPGILGKRLESASAEARRLWQRLLGVLELIVGGGQLSVFTTRADTLYGCTYVVISPEHPMVDSLTTPEQREAVEAYKKYAAASNEIEHTFWSRWTQ